MRPPEGEKKYFKEERKDLAGVATFVVVTTTYLLRQLSEGRLQISLDTLKGLFVWETLVAGPAAWVVPDLLTGLLQQSERVEKLSRRIIGETTTGDWQPPQGN